METMASKELISYLDTIACAEAAALKDCLNNAADITAYQHFLDTMYHYTLYSEDHLKLAAAKNTESDMKEYFMHMAKEERGHYLLAKRDLEEFGINVSARTPETVLKINKLWQDAAKETNPMGFLGIVYVFENIAKFLDGEIKSFLERFDVTKKQARWLLVHAEADLDHGEEAKEMIEKYGPQSEAIITYYAQEAGEYWIELIQYAFSPLKPEVFAKKFAS